MEYIVYPFLPIGHADSTRSLLFWTSDHLFICIDSFVLLDLFIGYEDYNFLSWILFILWSFGNLIEKSVRFDISKSIFFLLYGFFYLGIIPRYIGKVRIDLKVLVFIEDDEIDYINNNNKQTEKDILIPFFHKVFS